MLLFIKNFDILCTSLVYQISTRKATIIEQGLAALSYPVVLLNIHILPNLNKKSKPKKQNVAHMW